MRKNLKPEDAINNFSSFKEENTKKTEESLLKKFSDIMDIDSNDNKGIKYNFKKNKWWIYWFSNSKIYKKLTLIRLIIE